MRRSDIVKLRNIVDNFVAIDEDGYRWVKDMNPESPTFNRAIAEHRKVAEEMLGRLLYRGEVVHHKDRVRINNDPSNLEVFKNNAEHIKAHGKIPREPATKLIDGVLHYLCDKCGNYGRAWDVTKAYKGRYKHIYCAQLPGAWRKFEPLEPFPNLFEEVEE